MSKEQVGGRPQNTRTDILARYVLASLGNRLGFDDAWLNLFKLRQLAGMLVDSGNSRSEVFLLLSFLELCKQRREVAYVNQIGSGQQIFEALYPRCLKPASSQVYRPAVSIDSNIAGGEVPEDIISNLDVWLENLERRFQFPDGIQNCVSQAISLLQAQIMSLDMAKGVMDLSGDNIQVWHNLIGFWPNLEFHFIGLLYCALLNCRVSDLKSFLDKVDSEGEKGNFSELFHELKFSSCPAYPSILDAFQEALSWEVQGLRD